MTFSVVRFSKIIVPVWVVDHFGIDLDRFLRKGQVNTLFDGWKPAADHPVNLPFNLVFDAVACAGVVLMLLDYLRTRRKAAA